MARERRASSTTTPEDARQQAITHAVIAGIAVLVLGLLVWSQVRRNEVAAGMGALGSSLVAALGLGSAATVALVVVLWRRNLVTESKLGERERHANTDTLTGLLNRAGLFSRLENQVDAQGAARSGVALLFLDLDRFKMINDSLGHAAGDTMLQTVASRLQDSVRATDEVSRFGGDEFVVLCQDINDVNDVIFVAEKVTAALSVPVPLGSMDPVPGASIGIAIAEAGVRLDPSELIQNADAAMFRAKQADGSCWVMYDDHLREHAVHRRETELALRKALHISKDSDEPAGFDTGSALDKDEFRLLYQPVIDVQTGRLASVEALLRWNRPGHSSLLTPADFLWVAEHAGLMGKIGSWVVHEACTQVAHWRRLHGLIHPIPVAVNVSLAELSDPKFPDTIRRVLVETDLPASHLILEVEENAMIERVEYSLDGLNQLWEIGVGIAIDDFGHGMASLSYLKQLDMVTQIKVNPEFVAQLVDSDADRAIAGAIISVADALGKSTIAEGVETEGQLEVLDLLGVTSAQGNLLGAPMEPAKLGDLLVERDRWVEAEFERNTQDRPDPNAGRGGRRRSLFGAPVGDGDTQLRG